MTVNLKAMQIRDRSLFQDKHSLGAAAESYKNPEMCPQARLEPSTSQYVFGALDFDKITMKETERYRNMEEKRVRGVKRKKEQILGTNTFRQKRRKERT
jgi:hypothetical protein